MAFTLLRFDSFPPSRLGYGVGPYGGSMLGSGGYGSTTAAAKQQQQVQAMTQDQLAAQNLYIAQLQQVLQAQTQQVTFARDEWRDAMGTSDLVSFLACICRMASSAQLTPLCPTFSFRLFAVCGQVLQYQARVDSYAMFQAANAGAPLWPQVCVCVYLFVCV